MQERCVRYDPQTGKPQKLSRYNKSDICEQCREAERKSEQTPVGHEELFRAARALLDNNIEGEQTIIPTLVLAALSDMHQQFWQQFTRVGRAIVEAYGNDDTWDEVERAFVLTFQGIEPCPPVVGVPVIRIPPIGLSVLPDKSDDYEPLERESLIKGIILEVYQGTVEPDQIEAAYLGVLRLFSLPHTSTEVVYASRLTDTALQMVVRPAGEDPYLHPGAGSMYHPYILDTEGGLKKRQPAFPEPAWVAGTYSGLKARKLIPPKREGGSPHKAEKLIPAVVAFYLGGGSEELDKTEKARNTELVGSYLLETRQQSTEPKQRLNLWRTVEAALPQIRDAEERLVRPAARLHINF